MIIGLYILSVFEGIGILANVLLESMESVVCLDSLLIPVFEVFGFVLEVDSFSDMICQRDFKLSSDVSFFFES